MKLNRIVQVIAALSLFLTPLACSLPGSSAPATAGPANVETFAVQLTLTSLAGAPKNAAGTPAPVSTQSEEPSPTPTQTLTETPTQTPSLTPTMTNTVQAVPCNAAKFVADVTYPDDTGILINKDFTKTWRILNVGTCPWTSGYRLVFDHGDQMGAPASSSFTGGIVAPGGTVDISVPLKSPGAAGTYKGYFMLRSADNQIFGIGPSANGAFYVQIKALSILVPLPIITINPGPLLLPDLKVTSITITPNPATAHVAAHIKVVVHNSGGNAIKAFNVGWWGLDSFASTSCGWIVPSLQADKSVTLQCNYAYPSAYALLNSKATVDTGGAVAESNEGNNTLKVPVKVNP